MIDAVDVLEFTDKTGKRAVYEEFSFHDLGGGSVTVRNESHGAPSEHEHTVHVVGGIPSDCTCKADQYHDGACKHRVAVALRPALVEAAEADQAEPALATDGGLPEHLTTISTLTGGEVVHCQTCGGEGDSLADVDHHEDCPDAEGSA
jgi:hypothetical protein